MPLRNNDWRVWIIPAAILNQFPRWLRSDDVFQDIIRLPAIEFEDVEDDEEWLHLAKICLIAALQHKSLVRITRDRPKSASSGRTTTQMRM